MRKMVWAAPLEAPQRSCPGLARHTSLPCRVPVPFTSLISDPPRLSVRTGTFACCFFSLEACFWSRERREGLQVGISAFLEWNFRPEKDLPVSHVQKVPVSMIPISCFLVFGHRPRRERLEILPSKTSEFLPAQLSLNDNDRNATLAAPDDHRRYRDPWLLLHHAEWHVMI